jgi:hypothetical protein
MALPSETHAPELAVPLRVEPAKQAHLTGYYTLVDAGGRRLGVIGPDADAELRARQIVEAVNAYPELLIAARTASEFTKRVAEDMEP